MTSNREARGLHRFAVLTAVATLFLISVGGMVTSHGAGMAVPDWPNTYGYNMFFFPFSSWIGNIFYEHSHRLTGSLVGLLTVIQAAWFHGKRSRPVLRWTGVALLLGGTIAALPTSKRWQDAVVFGMTGGLALGASSVWPRSTPRTTWLRWAIIRAACLYGKRSRLVLRWSGAFLLLGGIIVALATSKRWQDAVVLGGTGAGALVAGFVWPRAEPQPLWLRRLALLALGLVVLQGVLGGLRVTLFKDEIGIVHATLAQLFFVLTSALALFTSRTWQRWGERYKAVATSRQSAADLTPVEQVGGVLPRHRSDQAAVATTHLGRLFGIVTLLVLGQLILGATMRHQHAGLAVPDFPLAYGKLWPATDPDSVAGYNRARLETTALNDITAAHILVHMTHRLTAVAVTLAIASSWWLTRRTLPARHALRRGTSLWLALVLLQFAFGAWTVWSNKAADVATLHVVTGALTLLTGSFLALAAFRLASPATPDPIRPPVRASQVSA